MWIFNYFCTKCSTKRKIYYREILVDVPSVPLTYCRQNPAQNPQYCTHLTTKKQKTSVGGWFNKKHHCVDCQSGEGIILKAHCNVFKVGRPPPQPKHEFPRFPKVDFYILIQIQIKIMNPPHTHSVFRALFNQFEGLENAFRNYLGKLINRSGSQIKGNVDYGWYHWESRIHKNLSQCHTVTKWL